MPADLDLKPIVTFHDYDLAAHARIKRGVHPAELTRAIKRALQSRQISAIVADQVKTKAKGK